MSHSEKENEVVVDLFDNYNETQREILAMEIKKTRTRLIWLSIIIFALDLIAITVARSLTGQTMIIIAILPAILIALSFLANKEPIVAMSIAALLIAGIWVYNIIILGASAIISGFIIKGIIIYMIIAGFQNAVAAHKIKKELVNSGYH